MDETAIILGQIPGGSDLLNWLQLSDGVRHGFGDDEIKKIVLDREGGSCLELMSGLTHDGIWLEAKIEFVLADMVSVSIEGFSHQNVIGGLKVRKANQTNFHPSLLGIGAGTADHEIIIEPCAGAFGSIQATIIEIIVTR